MLRAEAAASIHIHPDGEHGKQFDFASWLLRQEFAKVSDSTGQALEYIAIGQKSLGLFFYYKQLHEEKEARVRGEIV